MRKNTDTLGARLRLARTKRGLSQEQLAERAGLKQPDISKLERGDMLKTTGMARLSNALRVPAAWLELGEGPEPKWDGPGEPDAPPPGFKDRHVVSSSDWALLDAVKSVLNEEELAEIKKRAADLDKRVAERMAVIAERAKREEL